MKYVRQGILSLLFLGAVGALAGYLFFRRSVPKQAKYIPADAVFVLTADVRELGLNLRNGGEIIPPHDKEGISKQLAALSRALSDNKNGGIAQTADIQLFLFRRDDAAWITAAIELNDSASFGKFVRSPELGRELMTTRLSQRHPAFQIDSSGAVIGWNADVAMLLYPIGNHTVDATSNELGKLLKLPESTSIAANEAFEKSMLQDFDLSCWVNPAQLISFTQSKQLEALLGDIQQLHFTIDFTPGEVIVKRYIKENTANNITKSIAAFPAQQLPTTGFWELNVAQRANHPAIDLFFDDETLENKLMAELTGTTTLLLHNNITYTSHYYETITDENFVTTQREVSAPATEIGYSCIYELKKNSRAQQIFAEAMQADTTLTFKNNVYTIETGTLPKSAWFSADKLIVSTAMNRIQQLNAKPVSDQAYDARINISNMLNMLVQSHRDFPPQWLSVASLCSKHIESANSSNAVPAGEMKTMNELRLTFKNKEVNAMLQLRDIAREVAWILQSQAI